MMKTTISKDIDLADAKAGYDTACKQILSNKVVLAWILKSCVDEYRDCSIQDIAEKYILKSPSVARTPVHGDDPQSKLDGRIVGERNEDVSMKESTVTFDIRFPALLPHSMEPAEMIINLEAQRKYHPGYPLTKRGFYYICRLISSQRGTVFTGEAYEKIQKVYSIWICLDPPVHRQNSITKYAVKEEPVVGSCHENPENYDLMTLIMICLGNPEMAGADILQMLDVLLSGSIQPKEKKDILESKFRIPMTRKMEGEAEKMCNLSDAIEEKAMEKGEKKRSLESIRNLMKNLNLSLDAAMEALGLPEDERPEYRELLKGC